MKKSRLLTAILFVACLGSSPYMYAESLTGYVYDLGGTSSGQIGVPAVAISVRSTSEQEIANGATDAQGKYEININIPSGTPLHVYYEKNGYFSYPTFRAVNSLSSRQPPVELTQGGAGLEYYKMVASNISKAGRIGSGETDSKLASIASLPDSDKEKIISYLSISSPSWIYNGFIAADKTYNSTSQLLYTISSDSNKGLENVRAYPNFPKAGTIFLFGTVPNAASRESIEDLIKDTKGESAIENKIWVNYEQQESKKVTPPKDSRM